eukprot:1140283-Pelagomonas_calceolata.AAC.6
MKAKRGRSKGKSKRGWEKARFNCKECSSPKKYVAPRKGKTASRKTQTGFLRDSNEIETMQTAT